MPDRPDYFRCPLCRAVSCERLVIQRPNRPPYLTNFFHCSICTVVFLDPIAFTRGFEDRPRTASPKPSGNAYVAWSLVNQARKDRDD